MFVIRRRQVEAFDEAAARGLRERLKEFLRQEMPEQTADLSDEDLLKHIIDAEVCAAAYGIESDGGIASYVCLAMVAGPQFADLPRVAAFLKTPGTNAEQQLQDLIEFMDLQLGGEDD